MYFIIFYSRDGILIEHLSLDYCPKLNDAILLDGLARDIITRDLQEYPEYESIVYYCELSDARKPESMDKFQLEVIYETRLNKANKKSSIRKVVRDERRWN